MRFNIGDKVLVTREATAEEIAEWGDYWDYAMSRWVGRECKIISLLEANHAGQRSYCLRCIDGGYRSSWWFPECVLESAKPMCGVQYLLWSE
jgi:hypothetical protein